VVAAALAPLLAVPAAELGRALADFALPPCDSKPDLLHWLPLLNRLDAWLEGCAARADAALRGAAVASDEAFPAEEAVAVLRASTALLDFIHNRHLYGSAEVRARRGATARPPASTRALGALPARAADARRRGAAPHHAAVRARRRRGGRGAGGAGGAGAPLGVARHSLA
jgi:hypothetical protein